MVCVDVGFLLAIESVLGLYVGEKRYAKWSLGKGLEEG